jgi:osmotically-inducible protein OsmY
MTLRTWIRSSRLIIPAVVAAIVASAGLQAQSIGAEQRVLNVQRALERLPRYGVFDFLSFTIERGTVTLYGSVYDASLKPDAERAVKRVAGVDEVANRIEVLPASMNDDRIRQATFYRIYTDAFLSRYTSGGQQAAAYDAIEFGRIPGWQPFGFYPIRIIVEGGRTTLVGVVDNAADRQLAEFRAREVGGVFAVKNDLAIANK